MMASVGAAAAVPRSSTGLVDRPTGFGPLPFDGISEAGIGSHALSADGTFVVFISSSDSLLSGDEDSAENVYRLNRRTGALAQVNVSATGGQPTAASTTNQASISADGRYVGFFSNAQNLIPGAPPSGFYVKDMQTGAVELATRGTGADGAPAGDPRSAVISGDGRHVAFTAFAVLHADNATAADDSVDAYVRSLDAGTTHMVSLRGGVDGSGVSESASPGIDFHGDAVAYITDLAASADDTPGDDDAYVRTGIGTAGEATRFVSFTTGQTAHADTAEQVALSGDGTRVAWSTSSDCCAGSIFMASLLPNVTAAQRIDVPRPGGTGSGGADPAFEPVASANETPARLEFRSLAALDGADTNQAIDLYGAEVAHPGEGNFVHLETSGNIADVVHGGGALGGAIVAFDARSAGLPGGDGVSKQVYVNAGSGVTDISQPLGVPVRTSAVGNSSVQPLHAVSDDGEVVVFTSKSPVLGGAGRNNSLGGFDPQVLARDLLTGETTLVSAASGGAPGDAPSSAPSVDAVGEDVAFLSSASNLGGLPNPTHVVHAYVHDLATGTTTLVDRTAAGAPLSRGVAEAKISADGTHVVYRSSSPDAPRAPAGDTNTHIYAVDLAHGGATVLVDRGTGDVAANQDSRTADISGDGSRVAFVSTATNLGAGDPMGAPEVYVRDLTTNSTTWVSKPQDGNPLHASADEASISRSGSRVAFQQTAAEFGFGMTGSAQVFVRDLPTGPTVVASRGTDGAPVGRAEQPSLSADGTRITFGTVPPAESSLRSGFQVLLRDLAAGTTTLVSTRPDGAPARIGALAGSISGNGACVTFNSLSDDLVHPSYGPDYQHVFLRAVSADCPPVPEPGVATGTGGGHRPGDRTPPRISRAHLTHRRFAILARRTATVSRAARGTSFVFTLSEKARTTITVLHAVPGRRSGHRCVKPQRGLTRRCTRTVTVITLVRRHTHAGRNAIAFTGRAGRVALKPGRYRARLVAVDGARNRSRPVTLSFTVIRR